LSQTEPEVSRGAPLTGEQTREILADLGIGGAAADELEKRGIVATSEKARS
jgi:crotonobetainyl-CoA:carnitine CoA-transferase CaiB-like acyl-CoA transferase